MNAKARTFLVVVLILAVAGGIALSYKKIARPQYSIKDQYVEDNPQGRVVYTYVEMEKLDTALMKTVARQTMTKHKSLVEDTAKMVVVIAQYYRPQDVKPLTAQKMQELGQRNPMIPRIGHMLNIVDSAYIYQGLSKELPAFMNVPSENFGKSVTLVPKDEYSMESIFQAQRKIMEQAPH